MASRVTPIYDHVCDRRGPYRGRVYEPEADSFLLLDALDLDLLATLGVCAAGGHRSLLIAEVGVGSGIALAHASLLLSGAAAANGGHGHREGVVVDGTARVYDEEEERHPLPLSVVAIAADINPWALAATQLTFQRTFQRTAESALTDGAVPSPPRAPSDDSTLSSSFLCPQAGCHVMLECIRGDLTSHWWQRRASTPMRRGRGGGWLDVLIFNPPYVPTTDEELHAAQTGGGSLAEGLEPSTADWLPAAWAGGPQGRTLIRRFLWSLPDLLLAPPAASALPNAGRDGGAKSGGGVCYLVVYGGRSQREWIAAELRAISAAAATSATRECPDGTTVAAVTTCCSLRLTSIISRFTGEQLEVVRIEFGPPRSDHADTTRSSSESM